MLSEKFSDRFMPEPASGCWLWIGTINEEGYGRIWWKGRHLYAARVSVMFSGREIPDGLQVDHLCRNRCCVNPDHLEVVTQQENIARGEAGQKTGAQKRAITHCPRGHSYAEHGGSVPYRGRKHRRCLECHRLRERARARQK